MALLSFLYHFGIFLLGAICGALLASLISPNESFFLIMCVLGGIVALFFIKFVIILTTAFSGAYGVVSCFLYFNNREYYLESQLDQNLWSGFSGGLIVATFLMALVGFLVQYGLVFHRLPWNRTEPGERSPAGLTNAPARPQPNSPEAKPQASEVLATPVAMDQLAANEKPTSVAVNPGRPSRKERWMSKHANKSSIS